MFGSWLHGVTLAGAAQVLEPIQGNIPFPPLASTQRHGDDGFA
jgi:hypothetical protein